MHKPAWIAAAPILMQAFTVKPEPVAGMILNLEVIAQSGAGPITPPFRCDPLWPGVARHLMGLAPPDKLCGRAFGNGEKHAHFFGDF